jgi:hypothetical protein
MAIKTKARKKDMEHAAIPGTSLQVSRVALGTWASGGWMWGGTDEAESIATIRAAIERGINVIDTAPAYGFGRSEEIVGKALAEGGLRSRVLIATKVGLGAGKGVAQCQSRAHPAGDRRVIAPAANRSHRHLSGSLAGPAGRHRGNRRDHARPVRAGQDSSNRGEQLLGHTDGAFQASCAAARPAAAVQSV